MMWCVCKGPITEEDHILHTCDTPACIAEDHLFKGDQPSNMQDKKAKGRQNRGETHGMSKLTPEIVLAIRASDLPQKLLAARHGVSVPTISDIQRRHSWKHI